MTEIELAEMADLDAVVECWVDLADEQREHDSHLLPDANRNLVRESVGHHVLSGNVLVARDEASGEGKDGASGGGEDVANDEGEDLVGFVTFGPQSDSYDRDVERGIVRNIYVRPQYRGQGIGSELLAAVEARMAEEGMDTVALEVMADNEAARRLYRRRGYRAHRLELEKPLESDTHTN